MERCAFCSLSPARIWIETEHAIAVADEHPVADGHTLVIPRKHVSSVYELNMPEQEALWELVTQVRGRLLTGLTPDGFSIGFSDTMHDGISVDHVVVHLVPRHRGDNPQLADGVEWVTDNQILAWKK